MFENEEARSPCGTAINYGFETAMAGIPPHQGSQAGPDPVIVGEEISQLLALFEAHQSAKLRLCDELEAIADSLPENAGPKECLAAARSMCGLLRSAHAFEEDQLWPILRDLNPDDDDLDRSLERLRGEHWEDESYGDELASVLADWAMSVGNRNAEATGYMLRGFFEGVRRHIAFELEHLVPVLRQVLETRK
jgi:Hemerythrin HHE cation binding domain